MDISRVANHFAGMVKGPSVYALPLQHTSRVFRSGNFHAAKLMASPGVYPLPHPFFVSLNGRDFFQVETYLSCGARGGQGRKFVDIWRASAPGIAPFLLEETVVLLEETVDDEETVELRLDAGRFNANYLCDPLRPIGPEEAGTLFASAVFYLAPS